MTADRAQAGLPAADDYDPDALGTAELSAGEPEQTWEEYALELVPVMHNGEDTGRRLVRRNGNYLDSVTSEFKLLPNEEVVKAANEVAREMGADPFHEFDGDWFINLDDHVYQDQEGRRVHAVYAWEQGEIGGDDLEFGFAVHNSIDGSQSFNVGLFSFRHACANMVHMAAGTAQDFMARGVEDEREVLRQDSYLHRSGLEVDQESLQAKVKNTLVFVDGMKNAYSEWVEREIAPEEVAGLIKRLPQSDQPEWFEPVRDSFEEARENQSLSGETELTDERKAEIVLAHQPEAEAAWETYNSITESIWHDGESSDTTRHGKMRKVHRAMTTGIAEDG